MLNLPSSAFPQFSPKNFAFAAPLLRSEFRTKMKENKIHLKCSLRLTKIYLEVTVRVPVINCLVENKPGKSIQIRSLFSAKLFHFNFFVYLNAALIFSCIKNMLIYRQRHQFCPWFTYVLLSKVINMHRLRGNILCHSSPPDLDILWQRSELPWRGVELMNVRQVEATQKSFAFLVLFGVRKTEKPHHFGLVLNLFCKDNIRTFWRLK